MRRRRSARFVTTAAVAIALVGSSCSSKPKSALNDIPDAGPASTQATTTIATVASPLTGEQVSAAVAERPVVIVKVDNSPGARPQAGLDSADVIFEERVEGSVVRFLSLFQSKDATVVGPVRSVRSTDAAVLAPLGGVFAFSGGIKPFIDKVQAAGIRTVTESADAGAAVTKRAGKTRPYATYANTAKLRLLAKPVAPPPLFARLADGAAFDTANAGAVSVTGVRVVFGSLTTADWLWDASKAAFLRSTNNTVHVLEGGERLNTNCIILQTVPYRPTEYTDRSNTTVDEAVVTGSGDATVLCDGFSVAARWQKTAQKSVTTYTDAASGQPIKLPVGRVWVSLVPTNGVVTLKYANLVGSTTTSPK